MPAPTLEIDTELTLSKDARGVGTYVDATTGDAVLKQNVAGGWDLAPGYVSWYGQAAWEQAKAQPAGHQASEFSPISGPEARRLNVVDALSMPMGALNQHMTLAYTSPSGIVNLTPSGFAAFETAASSDAREARSLAGSSRLATTPTATAATPTTGGKVAGKAGAATSGQTPVVNAQTGFVIPRSLAAQLPTDTPARYEGGGRPMPAPTLTRIAPSTALPALTPAGATPNVNAQTGFVLPALKPATTSTTLTKTTAKTAAPTPTTGGKVAGKAGAATVKPPPAPPPVKTPTATAGVYRPGTTGTGPLR